MMTEVACVEGVFIIDSQIAFEQYLLKILT